MKAFIISTSLFLLLTFLIISLALFSGTKIEKIQDFAEQAANCILSGDEETALLLFSALQKDWDALHDFLLLTIHHSTLKPIELAITDAENAITLQNRDSLYAALVRLSQELGSLSDDLMRPAL